MDCHFDHCTGEDDADLRATGSSGRGRVGHSPKEALPGGEFVFLGVEQAQAPSDGLHVLTAPILARQTQIENMTVTWDFDREGVSLGVG